MKVYVVTSGCYSDYRIEAIFSTKAMADEYVERRSRAYRNEECDIETYELDELAPNLARSKNLFEYLIRFDKEFNFIEYNKYLLIDIPKNTVPTLRPTVEEYCMLDPREVIETEIDENTFKVEAKYLPNVIKKHVGWRVRVFAANKEKAFKIATDVLHAHRHHLSIMPKNEPSS